MAVSYRSVKSEGFLAEAPGSPFGGLPRFPSDLFNVFDAIATMAEWNAVPW